MNTKLNQTSAQISRTPAFQVQIKDLEEEVGALQAVVANLVERLVPYLSKEMDLGGEKAGPPLVALPPGINRIRELTLMILESREKLDSIFRNLEL